MLDSLMSNGLESDGIDRAQREDRYPTAMLVTLCAPRLSMFQAALVDLSANGARLRSTANLTLGTPVIVELEPACLLNAAVIWSCRNEIGIAFERPLNAALLRKLVVSSWTGRTD